MKNLLGAGMLLSLGLMVTPAVAMDQDSQTFHALSKVSAHTHETIPQEMSDEQLAAIEGAAHIAAIGQLLGLVTSHAHKVVEAIVGHLTPPQGQVRVVAVQGHFSSQRNSIRVFQINK